MTEGRRKMKPSSIDAELQVILKANGKGKLARVGAMALTARLWEELGLDPRIAPARRGLILCQLTAYIVQEHVRHSVLRKPACARCANKAAAAAWHVQWLLVKFDPEQGCQRRLSERQLHHLCGWLNDLRGADPLSEAALRHAPPQIRALLPDHNMKMLVRTAPRIPPGRKGAGPLDASNPPPAYYRLRAYSYLKQQARNGIAAHLRAGDPLVTAFLAARPELLAPPVTTPLSTLPVAPPSIEAPSIAAPSPASQPGAPPRIASPPTDRSGAPRRPMPAQPTQPAQRVPRRAHQYRAPSALHAHQSSRYTALAKMAGAWRWHPTWRLIRSSVSLAAAVALLVAAQLGDDVTAHQMTLAAAHLTGYVIALQWSTHSPRMLAVTSLRDGHWRQLWPPNISAEAQAALVAAGELPATSGGPTSPVYTPVTGQLAFVFQSGNAHGIWTLPLAIAADGWPTLDMPHTRALVGDCAGCDTLAWSPSGRWLLYNAPSGLMALDMTTGTSHSLTDLPGDGWPACSPDGRWLAYQRAKRTVGDIAVLPARDCLPTTDDGRAPRYVEGYRPSWHPAWSPDGQWLSFTSNVTGASRIYVATLTALLPTSDDQGLTAATLVSPGGCMDSTWATRDALTSDASNTSEAVAIAACDAPTPDNHHGMLVIAPEGDPGAWQVRLGEGVLVREMPWWIGTQTDTQRLSPSVPGVMAPVIARGLPFLPTADACPSNCAPITPTLLSRGGAP